MTLDQAVFFALARRALTAPLATLLPFMPLRLSCSLDTF